MEDLFTSSVAAAQTQRFDRTYCFIGRGPIRHVATSASQREEESTTKDQREKCFSCLVNKCVVKWTRTCPTRCACIVRYAVQMMLPLGSQNTRFQLMGCLKSNQHFLSLSRKVPASLVMNTFLDVPNPRSFVTIWLLTCFRKKMQK